MVEESSLEICCCRKFSRVESDGRERIILDSPGLDGGADVLGVPVPHSLEQEHGGRGEGRPHQHRPDDPGGPGLALVDVGQAVHAGGGEEVVQLQPEVGEISRYHGWRCYTDF